MARSRAALRTESLVMVGVGARSHATRSADQSTLLNAAIVTMSAFGSCVARKGRASSAR